MEILFPLLASAAWSANPILLKKALEKADPLAIHAFRIASIALLLSPWAIVKGTLPHSWTTWVLLLAAVWSGPLLAWAAYIIALRHLPVSIAHPLVNTYPLFAIGFEIFLWGTTPPFQGWVGVGLILFGMSLLHEKQPSQPFQSFWVGIGLGLATSFLWGLTSVWFKILVNRLSVYDIVFWRSTLASLSLLPFLIRIVRSGNAFPWRSRLYAALSGWLNDIIGLGLYLQALRIAPLYLVVPLSSLSPVLAYFWARQWLGEPYRIRRWGALTAVISGTILLSTTR